MGGGLGDDLETVFTPDLHGSDPEASDTGVRPGVGQDHSDESMRVDRLTQRIDPEL